MIAAGRASSRGAFGLAEGGLSGLGLERCETILAAHLAAAVARFGSPALGVIDLPSLEVAGRVAPDQLRVAGTLLWARELELAGLPSFTDELAKRFFEGRLLVPLAGDGRALFTYHREQDDRFDEGERRAIYAQIFGDPNDPGSPLARLEELCGRLAAIGRSPEHERRHLASQVRALALPLATDLSDRSVGIAAFAAREIVAHVRAALAILRDPAIASSIGGTGGVWGTIRALAPSLLGRSIDPLPHVERARAGLAVLEWLADSAAALEGGELSLHADSPVVRAAEVWRARLGAP